LLKLFAALDNITRGASGMAMQDANLMLGLDERAGLEALALTP
jgi:N-acetyl-gamma-glutamyl-phosphate reductase